MRQLLAKLRHLVLPACPNPAQSRRIAEIRLVFCGLIAIAIIGTIGTRIVGLAEAHTNLRLALHGQAAAPRTHSGPRRPVASRQCANHCSARKPKRNHEFG